MGCMQINQISIMLLWFQIKWCIIITHPNNNNNSPNNALPNCTMIHPLPTFAAYKSKDLCSPITTSRLTWLRSEMRRSGSNKSMTSTYTNTHSPWVSRRSWMKLSRKVRSNKGSRNWPAKISMNCWKGSRWLISTTFSCVLSRAKIKRS
jgi:hypothetical protein